MSSKKPLTDEALAAWEDSRDLAAELEQSIREMNEGIWARKTEFFPQSDGSVRKLVTLADGTIEHDSIIPKEQWNVWFARAQIGLSQTEFAKLLGVSVRTLQGWEQGRRNPSGAARTLLEIARINPGAIQSVVNIK